MNSSRSFFSKAPLSAQRQWLADGHGGKGYSSTVFSASQTDLQSLDGNKYRQIVDGGFPTITGNVLTFQITVSIANANFAWNEWGVFNAAIGGTMLNRAVQTLGTKASTQSWQFTVTITVQNS